MGVALNPSDTVLIRQGRGETWTQRRSHVEAEAETGGRRPPAQGWTPGAPRSWKRQEGPSPGASAGSSVLGQLEPRHLVPRAGGACVFLASSRVFLRGAKVPHQEPRSPATNA